MFFKPKKFVNDFRTLVFFDTPEPLALIYLAGPYTKPNPNENVHKTILVAEALVRLGFIPYVPHLHHLWDVISPQDWSYWMRITSAILLRCDALLLLPGESKGAELEVTIAKESNLPIYHNLTELLNDKGRSRRVIPVDGSERKRERELENRYPDRGQRTWREEVSGRADEERADSPLGDDSLPGFSGSP